MRVRGGGAYEKHKAVKELDRDSEDLARPRLNVLPKLT